MRVEGLSFALAWAASADAALHVNTSRYGIAMADLKAQFDDAVAASRHLNARPDNAVLLKLYALFKQASLGDVTGERPDMFDAVGTAKYDAWEALRATSQDQAMQAYVALIEKLKSA